MKILVADDEPVLRQLLERLLTNDGHEVELAANGKEALQKVEGGRWDAVFTDHEMPGMNGFEFAAAVKKAYPDLPLIMVSGTVFRNEEKATHFRWLDAFVPKPFTRAMLQAALNAAIIRCGTGVV